MIKPKVAIVSNGSYPNYLIDIVADGFLRLLGDENIYIQGFNFSQKLISFPWLYTKSLKHINNITLNDCDLIVEDDRTPELIETTKPRVIVDGNDGCVPYPKHLERCDIYYTREYKTNTDLDAHGGLFPKIPKVKSMQFAVVPETLENLPRDIPLYCNITTGDRGKTLREEIIQNIKGEGFNITNTGTPHERYVHLLQRSQISIAPKGSGEDCYRHWEIPYFGALLFSEKRHLLEQNPYIDGEECFYFESVPELQEKLNIILQDKKRLEKIRLQGHQKCLKHHLSIHRAERILQDMGFTF